MDHDRPRDLSQLLTRWGQSSAAPPPRPQPRRLLAAVERALDDELGPRAAALAPLLAMVAQQAEALFPGGGMSPLPKDKLDEDLAALWTLLDQIEDAAFALGLGAAPRGPREDHPTP